ncbi:MAG TPA: calcium-binding protein, partial [Solirubrobacteraceae bacterium]|nr:calcium-binding protein [Solirubrobacteraceae bacterium]
MSDLLRVPRRALRAGVLATVLAAALIALPAEAQAGRARISSGRVIYDAFAGERNDVTVRRLAADRVRVTDAGAPVVAGTRCRRLTTHLAECRSSPRAPDALVRLGDLDDQARGPAFTDGGEGDDTLTGPSFGGPGDDVLSAGTGAGASLDGGPGADTLNGAGGDDRLHGGPGVDRIISGGGRDTLSFEPPFPEPGVPVDFSLQGGAHGGVAGEEDVYDGTFAVVLGATPRDHLTGDDAHNELRLAFGSSAVAGGELIGLGGDDVLGGSTGADRLEGGAGGDALSDGDLNGAASSLDGGDGDDLLNAYDVAEEEGVTDELELAPTQDALACGPGKDRVNVDVADEPGHDCEIVGLRTPTRTTVTGTDQGDRLDGFSGDGAADVVRGLAGDDRLAGAGGGDRLYGGPGADLVLGGSGDDRLTGDAGHDRLDGGPGSDKLYARDGRRDTV